MHDFTFRLLKLAEYKTKGTDQELSAGDKLLILQEADEFCAKYKECTNEEPVPSIPTLELFYTSRLQQFGISIPIIDGWIREDMQMIHQVISERPQPVFKNKER